MGKLKTKLPGSSMIEAIVASLIFMIVFVASLSVITGYSLREDESYALLEAERRLSDCFDRYGDGTWAQGVYTDTFEWGVITTAIAPYDGYEGMQQVAMQARLDGSRKIIEYRRLILLKDE